MPRVLFEQWSINDIMKIYNNVDYSQTQLIVSLLDAAEVKKFKLLNSKFLRIYFCAF